MQMGIRVETRATGTDRLTRQPAEQRGNRPNTQARYAEPPELPRG